MSCSSCEATHFHNSKMHVFVELNLKVVKQISMSQIFIGYLIWNYALSMNPYYIYKWNQTRQMKHHISIGTVFDPQRNTWAIYPYEKYVYSSVQRGEKFPETFHGNFIWGILEIFQVWNLPGIWEFWGIYGN